MIACERLLLIPATPELVRADLQGRSELASALGVDVPSGWPPELHDEAALGWTLTRLETVPAEAEWWLHYFALRDEAGAPEVLVGAGGYKGPPDAEGSVEIGYTILHAFRRRGLASEAARGLVAHAFERPDVRRVVAETLPSLAGSIAVLERCGFRRVPSANPEEVLRYALERSGARGAGPPRHA